MDNKLIKDYNFYSVQGWMVSRLNLKGNELAIYAIIYGFSQKEGSWYDGNHSYLAEWISSSKQTVMTCLKSLIEKGYIDKKEIMENGVKLCRYKASFLPNENCFEAVKKFDGVVSSPVKNFDGVVSLEGKNDEKFDHPDQNILPTHIINNIYNNNNKERKVFSKPTLSEIEEYCRKENIQIDAYQFYHFYESKDWMVGKSKMKQWKSAVRTWEARNRPKQQQPNSNYANQSNPEEFDAILEALE